MSFVSDQTIIIEYYNLKFIIDNCRTGIHESTKLVRKLYDILSNIKSIL